MNTDINIWRTAFSLVEQHGEDAEFFAAQRVDEFYLLEDRKEYRAWKRIRRAIGQLQEIPTARAH